MRFLLIFILLSGIPVFAGWVEAQEFDITDIVAAHDAYIDAPTKANRASVLQALAEYTGEPTVETVQAHHTIMTGDTQAGNYDAMYESGTAARLHYEPVADLIQKQFSEASFVAAVARFNGELEPAAMIDMAHVQGYATAQREDNGERAAWARDLMYKSDAWVMTMDAYFESTRERHPSDAEIEEILSSYGADNATINAVAATNLDESGLPFCSGEMVQKPKLRYPRRKYLRGMFGAVILGLEFDDQGQVINPVVLASVPLDEFDDRSLRAVGKWHFKPDEPEQVGVTCRLNRANVVQPLVFQFR